MTTQIAIFLVIVSVIFGVLLYFSIKNNREIEREKQSKKQSDQ